MTHVDMTQPDRVLVPGVDLWEIKEAKEEKSGKGDPMIVLKFSRVSNPSDHLYDRLMLAGNGWPIGKKKLGALLPADFKGSIDMLNLVGVRLWVSTGVEIYKEREQLRVMSDLKHAGFQKAADVPPGCKLPEPASDADDSRPF